MFFSPKIQIFKKRDLKKGSKCRFLKTYSISHTKKNADIFPSHGQKIHFIKGFYYPSFFQQKKNINV